MTNKKSPFPGMDPYLEMHWGDVHTSLMVYIRNQINLQLPDELQARVEESTAIQIEDDKQRTAYPDVRVVEDQVREQSGDGGGVAIATETIATAKPIIIKFEIEPRKERTVEIVDISSNDRVVTAIEVISPSNKIGYESRLAYKRKQQGHLDSGVNLVEIDLVREGNHTVAILEQLVPSQYRNQSMACVRRASKPLQVELYPMPLRERLPDISIPLRPVDKDVLLQTQVLIDQCYQDGRYWRTDYTIPSRPQLSDQDTDWFNSLLASRSLSSKSE